MTHTGHGRRTRSTMQRHRSRVWHRPPVPCIWERSASSLPHLGAGTEPRAGSSLPTHCVQLTRTWLTGTASGTASLAAQAE